MQGLQLGSKLAPERKMCPDRWMEREYGHHVAQSLPAESDTGLSAKKIMEEASLPSFTLEQARDSHPPYTPFMGRVRGIL
jgi:hypothetical protein